jgi:hypothetical protein
MLQIGAHLIDYRTKTGKQSSAVLYLVTTVLVLREQKQGKIKTIDDWSDYPINGHDVNIVKDEI